MTEELAEQRTKLIARAKSCTPPSRHSGAVPRGDGPAPKGSLSRCAGPPRSASYTRVRENREPDEELLTGLALDLTFSLEPCDEKTRYRLDALRTALGGIGVSLSVAGDLPRGGELTALAVDVITEGSTNAVRHGFATRVDVELSNEQGVFRVVVRDNGIPPRGPIREGGGLGGMRLRINELGGALKIVTEPRFVLCAEIPAGERARQRYLSWTIMNRCARCSPKLSQS